MNWQTIATVVGLLLVVEGAMLLLMRKEAWRQLCERLAGMSVEQVHVAGAVIGGVGALLLWSGI